MYCGIAELFGVFSCIEWKLATACVVSDHAFTGAQGTAVMLLACGGAVSALLRPLYKC